MMFGRYLRRWMETNCVFLCVLFEWNALIETRVWLHVVYRMTSATTRTGIVIVILLCFTEHVLWWRLRIICTSISVMPVCNVFRRIQGVPGAAHTYSTFAWHLLSIRAVPLHSTDHFLRIKMSKTKKQRKQTNCRKECRLFNNIEIVPFSCVCFCLTLSLPVYLENCKQTSQSNRRPFARAIENLRSKVMAKLLFIIETRRIVVESYGDLTCAMDDVCMCQWHSNGNSSDSIILIIIIIIMPMPFTTTTHIVALLNIFLFCVSRHSLTILASTRCRSSFITRLFHIK